MNPIFHTNKSSLYLPGIYAAWNIQSCISLSKYAQIYLLLSPDGTKRKIVKIIPERWFHKKIYSILSNFKDSYLCLPQEHIQKKQNNYVFYPSYTTLQEILLGPGMSFQEIITLGIHLCRGVSYLLSNQYYAIDISPRNIYYSNTGEFCLGDLSLFTCNFSSYTPGYFSPSLHDIPKQMVFAICKLLFLLLNDGRSLEEAAPSHIPENLLYLLQQGIHLDSDSQNIFSDPCLSSPLSLLEDQLLLLSQDHEVLEGEQRIQFCDPIHPFFQVETIPMEYLLRKNTSIETYCKKAFSPKSLVKHPRPKLLPGKLFPLIQQHLFFIFLWSVLIIAGCTFLIFFYQFLHPGDSGKKLPSPPLSSSLSFEKAQEKEWDIQRKNLSSLSSPSALPREPDSVTCLYAGQNQLSRVQGISVYSSLKELYLNENQLTDLEEISLLPKLQYLILCQNQITDISPLSHLEQLEYLDLSSNPMLKDITGLNNIKSLRTLVLTDTSIPKSQISRLRLLLPQCTIVD